MIRRAARRGTRAAGHEAAELEVIRDPLWDNIRVDRPALLALDTAPVTWPIGELGLGAAFGRADSGR